MGKRKAGKKVVDFDRERRILDNIQNIKDVFAGDSTALNRLTDKLMSLPNDSAFPKHEKPVSESRVVKCNPSNEGRHAQGAGKSLISPLMLYKKQDK